MSSITQLAILTLTTIFAGTLAFVMVWAFLRGAFHLMQPAAVHNSRTSAPRMSRQFQLRSCAGHAGCDAAICTASLTAATDAE
jgi:hypothetical protein